MNTTKIICTVIYIIFIVATFFSIGNVSQFFDINSFIFVIVVGGLYAFSVKGENTYIQKFGDGTVRAGWLGSLIGVVAILWEPSICWIYFQSGGTWSSFSNRITYSFVWLLF